MASSTYDFSATDITGVERSLEEFRGKALLIVNVASKCGFTPQYAGLQQLHQQYAEQGFSVLGFPCDQFGHQEPGNEAEIQSFCQLKYDVTFPLFEKIDVNGANAHPLYQWLKDQKPGVLGTKRIKWNFTKFLVDANGKVRRRYAPTDKPESIAADVARLLG